MATAVIAFRRALAVRSALCRRMLPAARWPLRVPALTIVLLGSLAAVSVIAEAAIGAQKTTVTLETPVTGGSRYLSLGDSVTFGYQEQQVVPAPNYHNQSSFLGYPEQLGAELHLPVSNAACPGETSSSLINASAQSNGCENAYRKSFPLHVSYKGAQLAYGVAFLRSHRDVKLVSLMIGANDIFLCQKTTSDGCASTAEQNAVFARIAHNVSRILSAVRNQAHYRGQLAIVNYYSLNYTSAFITNASLGLNKAMDGAAKPFHVVVADSFGELKAATRRFGGDPCAAGLLTQLGKPGKCGVHPTYAGQALLAQALLKAIRL